MCCCTILYVHRLFQYSVRWPHIILEKLLHASSIYKLVSMFGESHSHNKYRTHSFFVMTIPYKYVALSYFPQNIGKFFTNYTKPYLRSLKIQVVIPVKRSKQISFHWIQYYNPGGSCLLMLHICIPIKNNMQIVRSHTFPAHIH